MSPNLPQMSRRKQVGVCKAAGFEVCCIPNDRDFRDHFSDSSPTGKLVAVGSRNKQDILAAGNHALVNIMMFTANGDLPDAVPNSSTE